MVDSAGFRATVGWLRHQAQALNSRHDCIAELIKNSYDADATEVEVDLQRAFLNDGKAILVISDNGHGMDEESIRLNWNPIGHSVLRNKSKFSKKFGRPYQGGKGLGRTGLFQIGETVVVATKMEGRPAVAFKDDLSGMKDSDAIEQIPRSYDPNPERFFPDGKAGTKLFITNFKHPIATGYTNTSIVTFCEKMNKSLAILSDPFHKDDTWSLTPIYPDTIALNPLPNYRDFFDQAPYIGTFVAHGQNLTGTLFNKNQLCPRHHETKEINIAFSDIKKITHGALDASLLEFKDTADLSNVEIEIAAFSFNDIYHYYLEGMGIIGKNIFRDYLAGSYIYKDGIRVTMDGVADPFLSEFHHTNIKMDIFRQSVCMICVNFRQQGNEGLRQGHSRVFFEPSPERSALTAAVREALLQLRAFAVPIPSTLPVHMLPPDVSRFFVKCEPGASLNEEVPNLGGPPTGVEFSLPLELMSTDITLKVEGGALRLVGTAPEEQGNFSISGTASNVYGESQFSVQLSCKATVPPPPPPPPTPTPPPPPTPLPPLEPPLAEETWAAKHPTEHQQLLSISNDLQRLTFEATSPDLDLLRRQLEQLSDLIERLERFSGP